MFQLGLGQVVRSTITPPRPTSLFLEANRTRDGEESPDSNMVHDSDNNNNASGSRPVRRKKKRRPANAAVKFEGMLSDYSLRIINMIMKPEIGFVQDR